MRQLHVFLNMDQCWLTRLTNRWFMKLFIIPTLIIISFLTPPPLHAASGAPIVFSAPGRSLDNIYVTFLGGTVTGKYYDQTTKQLQNLENGKAYSLKSLISPISVGGNAPVNEPAVYISNWVGGRLYFSLGTGITAQPNPACSSDPYYSVRWAYAEPTFDSTGVHTNITYIDNLSLSYSLQAINAPNAKNNPLLSPDLKTLVTVAATAAKVPAGNVLPSPSAILPNKNFVRLLPPMATCNPTVINPLYHDWTNYLQTTLKGKTIRIKGCYAGGGVDADNPETLISQSYDYIATVSSDTGTLGNITLVAQTDSGQQNSHCGGITGTGIGSDSTMSIEFSDLNLQNGIYGGNPPYTWSYKDSGSITHSGKTTGLQNNVFGWIVADLLTGLNYGFPGSTVLFNGTAIGDLNSTQWWGGQMPDGTKIDHANTPGGQDLYCDKAQPSNPTSYNTYLNVMMKAVPSAYAYALQERMGKVLLEFDQGVDSNSYLALTINPDMPSSNAPLDLLLLNQ